MSGSNTSLCPSCKKESTLHGKAMTLAVTCSACGTYYRTGSWNRNIIKFPNKEVGNLTVGQTGTFEEVNYRVMGFVVKQEQRYKYTWKEYLLFNPYHGFAFLSEYNGHWNFIWPLETDPKDGSISSTFEYEDNSYKLYQQYDARVLYAEGEFFFDVCDVTASSHNREYISPPFLIGIEQSEDGIMAYQGEYLTPKEVADAFKKSVKDLPGKSCIGYTQPFGGSFGQDVLIKTTIAFGFILIFLQLFLNSVADDAQVFHEDFHSGDQKVIVTQSFELPGNSQSLGLEIYSPVDNNWFVADFALVNEADGTEYNFTKEVEYYHGYEGGESWTEGSRQGEAFLSKIPQGKYHINIYPEFGSTDIAFESNLFVAFLLLLVFPVGYSIYRYSYEKRRWSESDYSPYE
jgi:hypothetical protein